MSSSCKSKRNKEGHTKLKNKSPKELVECLINNETKANWLTSKASIKIGFRDEEYALKSNLRMRVDSATWISLSKVTVPAIKAVISQDSAKLLLRLGKKQYYVNDFESINEMLRADLDYHLLENFFLGNPIAFAPDEDYKSTIDGQFYLLSTQKSKRIERMLEKGKTGKSPLLYRCWIDPTYCKATKIMVDLIEKRTSLEVNYSNFEEIDGQIFPMKASMKATSPTDTIWMEMDYSTVTLNVPAKISFKIPSSYKPLIIPIGDE